MRRSQPRLLILGITLSVLCCVATGALWVLSYLVPVQGGAHKLVDKAATRAVFYGFDSTRGVLGLSYTDLRVPGGHIRGSFSGWKFDLPSAPAGPLFSDSSSSIFARLGLHAVGDRWQGGRDDVYAITIHYWVALAFFLLVFWVLRRRFSRALARREPGICAKCGYDLRATPERCPECGLIAAENAGGRERLQG